jgi:hypothetical protein
MKLVELYLDDIKHHLPPRDRDDILREIRSTLMDMIEDRNPNPGQTPDEALVKEVLTDFGAPRIVARQYGARNYLIGPRFFPIYLQVLKIVLVVVGAVNVLGLVLAVVNQTAIAPNMFEAILEIVGGLFSSLFTAFGIVTLTFAGIERTTSEEIKIEMDEAWSPEDLLKQENTQRVKVTEQAIEITLTIIFLTVLNFFRDKIGIYYLTEAGWSSAPILNENFIRYIPWITAFSVLDIALNLYLIRKGFWDKFAVISKILINALNAALLIAVITGPAIFTISKSAWEALNWDLAITAGELTQGLNTGFDVLLGLAIFGLAVDSIKRLYEGFIKGRGARIEFDTDES